MAILASLSPTGQPRMEDILKVVGPFPVAGLAWWANDWHAYRCCPTPHLHQGLDMMAASGTPVVACANGYISEIVNNPDSSGQAVQLTDPVANVQFWYMHLSAYATGLRVGQPVRIGEVIGYVGDTGDPLPGAYHLHFEVRPNGVPVPPIPYVNTWLAQAEQKAFQLAGPASYSEATFPYAITAAELQLWMARAAALQHDTSQLNEGDFVAPLPGAGRSGQPGPSPSGRPGARSIDAAPAGFVSTPLGVGTLAAVLLLAFIVLPGIRSGRRQEMELQAAVARAAETSPGGAPAPRPAPSLSPQGRHRPTGPRGGSATVAAR